MKPKPYGKYILITVFVSGFLALLWPLLVDYMPRKTGDTEHSRMHELQRALRMYPLDNDHMPPMGDVAQMQQALYPDYINNPENFLEETTRQPFRPNPALSKVKIEPLQSKADKIPLIVSPRVHENGSVLVGFLNGSMRYVQKSQIPF